MEPEATNETLLNEWAPKPDVIAQLAAFIDALSVRSYPNNLWLSDDRMEVYVRHSRRRVPHGGDVVTLKCLDIGNANVYDTGKGIFSTQFLPQAIKLNPWDAVYAENVLTDRFANFFRKQGWLEIPGLTPCFFLVKKP